ncbi:pseudouridine synthase [Caballeronia arvi]|uniref:Pseudouridine synthase n=2 Tax=Caballeronia arvi TaxID=1777135 RepID=A0A158FGC8_9BURK|nr:pseudouridine synthase [Caballeronia arvi]
MEANWMDGKRNASRCSARGDGACGNSQYIILTMLACSGAPGTSRPHALRCRIRFTPRAACMSLIALNKPFGTICQFSAHETRASLGDWVKTPNVYPAGRLDADSEGLLLLTDDGALQARIAEPRHKLVKRYWAQVEGAPDDAVLARLAKGVDLGDYVTRACRTAFVAAGDSDALWPRNPPVRYRAAIPTTWIELAITEGKNRQVRRMTAAVGHPTLRLVRVAIGALDLFALGLAPGETVEVPPQAPWQRVG